MASTETNQFLDSINSDFKAYGICYTCIPIEPENRNRSTRFRGVPVKWRKELLVRKRTDRVILVVAKSETSTNQSVNEFRHTLEHTKTLYDTYSANGSVVILGDFNAHLLHGDGDKNPVKLNERGRSLEQFLDERMLMSVSCQMVL